MQRLLLYIAFIFVATSCANISAPTGGEKDIQPPRIDTTKKFTPNFQTNFDSDFISLPFDEWIVLKDVINQVVISPPLEKPINVKLKKRTVVIDFSEEELRENTTYTINFGEAIQDLNEGNFEKNFRYIFSTGNVIDSLEVRGSVVDALTAEPIPDIFVVLYDDLTDSVVHKERPYYFAKTDETGRFTIPYVKQDTFKLFALKDENANYKYDLPNEKIAFLNENIITGDTNFVDPVLRFFVENPPLKAFRPKSPHYGYIPILFNNENLKSVKIEPLEPIGNLETQFYTEKDTLKYWYRNVDLDSLNLVVSDGKTLQDTIMIKLENMESYLKTKPKMTSKASPTLLQINPDKPIRIQFNHLIGKVDTSKIIVLEDTSKRRILPKIEVDSLLPNVLKLHYKWKENKPYQLIFPDSTIFDFHQFTNDTIEIKYKVAERKTFGNVTATAEGLDENTAYIIQVLTKENLVVETFYSKGKTKATKKFLSLPPKDYKLRLIIDENENRIWDTGNYPTNQPEKAISNKDVVNLRANWELDLKILLED
jgi:ribosomal protein L22